MASKEKLKRQSRSIYFKDPNLWDRIKDVAIQKKWSLNQVVQDMVEAQLKKVK